MGELTWFFDLGNTLVANGSWMPGARLLLDRLSSTGASFGVISNTGTLSRAQLAQLLPADFDFGAFSGDLVILSSEVGLEKPDLRIFRLAGERAGVPLRNCLLVGEDLEETMAAQSAGMRAARICDSLADYQLLEREWGP